MGSLKLSARTAVAWKKSYDLSTTIRRFAVNDAVYVKVGGVGYAL